MVTTKWFLGNGSIEDAYFIRNEVFIKEQGFDASTDADATDKIALHLVVYSDEKPVGTARLFFKDGYHIGRVAVLKDYRGRQIGDLIMRMLLVRAFNENAECVTLDSQEQAAGFYKKYGFMPVGEPFLEEHKMHIKMVVTPQTLNIMSKCGHCGHKE